MYFKTKKNSVTGQKLQAILEKIQEAGDAQIEMAKKYHIEQWRSAMVPLAGGFSSVVFEPGFTPDPKVWKNVNGSKEFMPKLSSKEGKMINAEFKQMPMVKKSELNDIFGFDGGPFRSPGYNANNPEYFGINTMDDWEIIIPYDVIEITMTEFRKLFPSFIPGR